MNTDFILVEAFLQEKVGDHKWQNLDSRCIVSRERHPMPLHVVLKLFNNIATSYRSNPVPGYNAAIRVVLPNGYIVMQASTNDRGKKVVTTPVKA